MADKENDEEANGDDGNDDGNDDKPLPGEGTEDGKKLRDAEVAFDRGDYARVRELSRGLLEAPDAAVAGQAKDLLSRTQIDPVQVGVVVACLALFAYIVYTYVLL